MMSFHQKAGIIIDFPPPRQRATGARFAFQFDMLSNGCAETAD